MKQKFERKCEKHGIPPVFGIITLTISTIFLASFLVTAILKFGNKHDAIPKEITLLLGTITMILIIAPVIGIFVIGLEEE